MMLRVSMRQQTILRRGISFHDCRFARGKQFRLALPAMVILSRQY
jgi:hypothetical protein